MDKIIQDNDIKIKFDAENEIILNSDNPDLNGFVSKVVELKEKCNFEQLSVETNNSDFDKEGFKGILLNSIKSFLEDIKISEEELKSALNSINELKNKS